MATRKINPFCKTCAFCGVRYNVAIMSKNVPMMGVEESSAGKSPATKPKASLTPEQEHYVDESFKRFDTLYRKLAE